MKIAFFFWKNNRILQTTHSSTSIYGFEKCMSAVVSTVGLNLEHALTELKLYDFTKRTDLILFQLAIQFI